MNRHYPLEALLRPPVELWSSLTATATGAIAVFAPWALMLPPSLAYSAAGGLFLFALWRARQGFHVLRYQRNLRRLREYRCHASRIPVSHSKLFLGRGFRWTQRHTQRLRDARRPELARYINPGPCFCWARTAELAWEKRPVLRVIARGIARQSG